MTTKRSPRMRVLPNTTEMATAAQRYLVTGPRNLTEIMHHLGAKRATTFDCLEKLVDEGILARIGKSTATRYAIASEVDGVNDINRNYRIKQTPKNGDPSHRVIRFGAEWRPGTGIRAKPRGLGSGVSSLVSVYADGV